MSDPAIQMGLFLFNVYRGPVIDFLAARFSHIRYGWNHYDAARPTGDRRETLAKGKVLTLPH